MTAGPSLRRCAPPIVTVTLLLALAAPARAAGPMITDDAGVAEPHTCQLESWVRSNPSSTEIWVLPACSLGERTELTLGGAIGRGGALGRSSEALIQVKHLLRPLDERGWGAGIAVGQSARSETAHRSGLAGDAYATLLFSAASRDEALVLHLNLGWQHQRDRHRDRGTWGLGFEARLAPRWTLFGESFGDGAQRPGWQLGVGHWLAPERVQLVASAGDRWGGPGGERWLSIGIRLLSPPLLP